MCLRSAVRLCGPLHSVGTARQKLPVISPVMSCSGKRGARLIRNAPSWPSAAWPHATRSCAHRDLTKSAAMSAPTNGALICAATPSKLTAIHGVTALVLLDSGPASWAHPHLEPCCHQLCRHAIIIPYHSTPASAEVIAPIVFLMKRINTSGTLTRVPSLQRGYA